MLVPPQWTGAPPPDDDDDVAPPWPPLLAELAEIDDVSPPGRLSPPSCSTRRSGRDHSTRGCTRSRRQPSPGTRRRLLESLVRACCLRAGFWRRSDDGDKIDLHHVEPRGTDG